MFVEQLRRAVEASPRAELPARVAHPLLPLPRPPSTTAARLPAALRAVTGGVYRLPHDVRDRLAAALAPFRNRDAAFALATFLGRFWSTPARLLDRLPDRPARAGGACRPRPHGSARARRDPGAGGGRLPRSGRGVWLNPQADARGPAPQAGAVHVRGDYGPLFGAANRRAAAARERRSGARRGSGPAAPTALHGAPNGSAA